MAISQLQQEYIWKTFAIFGSCMAAIVLYGVSYSPGVYFPIFIDAFEETHAKTAWVGSLMMAWSFLSSPVASLLVNRFGCRVTTIIAGLITVTGLAISSQAQSLYVLCITYGVMAGAGCGLLYIPFCVIIVEHFGKDSSMYLGLASGVGGLGSFIFPPIIRFLVDIYGWRGSLLVCAGISMHICLAGAMMHPGKKLKNVRADQDRQLKDNADKRASTDVSECEAMNSDCLDQLNNSCSDIHYEANDKSPLETKLDVDASEHSNASMDSSVVFSNSDAQSKYSMDLESTNESCHPLLPSLETKTCMNNHADKLAKNTSWKKRLHLEDMSIFKDISYSILCFQQILYCIGASVIYVHLGAYAECTLNISKIHSAMLFSAIGATLLVSKIVWGFLLKIPTLQNRIVLLYTLTLSVTGLSTFVLPLITSYTGLVAYSIIFGLGYCAMGGAIITSTIIEIAGVEKLSIAYGFVIYFEGIGFIIGPPIAGWLYDTFQSYNTSFILSATLILISCLTMAIPVWRQANHGNSSTVIVKEVLVKGVTTENIT